LAEKEKGKKIIMTIIQIAQIIGLFGIPLNIVGCILHKNIPAVFGWSTALCWLLISMRGN
jgi:hypothetical protein